MTDVVLLYDSVSNNETLKHEAKDKLAAKKAKGLQLREASQLGQVRKRDLMEIDTGSGSDQESELEGGRSKKIRRAPKNQFAKEVEGVIGGLHEKSEEFRTAMQEKAERDRNLGAKLDELIETTRNPMRQWNDL